MMVGHMLVPKMLLKSFDMFLFSKGFAKVESTKESVELIPSRF